MAVFVDLDEEEDQAPAARNPLGAQPEWRGDLVKQVAVLHGSHGERQTASEQVTLQRPNPNKNGMTEALGCYPIIMAIASSIDLTTLDNLSRTCRQIHSALLQYRAPLLANTLHCMNEAITIDPEDTFRFRARATNWYYVEDGRNDYNGKSGNCARDMVAECRRCATVVCRNCAIKPPAPKVFRDRHRRLCIPCTKAPLPSLLKPPLKEDTPLYSDEVQRGMCRCVAEGVWLCQPCGRSIRGLDHDYHRIWKWRNQYGEVIGGLGNGIGDGDRGVPCGREAQCCAAREREQEIDCDPEDARLSEGGTPPWGTPETSQVTVRTPSPQSQHLRPGYARHEIEGIGGVVKTKLVQMVKVSACVPEWEDEKSKGEVLGRETRGQVRSWCGWCWRVIPSLEELEEKPKGRQLKLPLMTV